MKKNQSIALFLFLLVLIMMLTSCRTVTTLMQKELYPNDFTTTTPIITETPIPGTANDLVIKMQKKGLPIINVIVDNENYGGYKPLYYTSSVEFADSRIPQTSGVGPIGGYIEVFNNTNELENRRVYLKNLQQSYGDDSLNDSFYVNGNYLLRLCYSLTPKQLSEYEKVFMTLK